MMKSYTHPTEAATKPSGPLKLILAVDDEHMITELYRRCFPSHRFRVITVNDPTLAIEALKIETPRLILMDLKMPGLDGIELYKTLKQRPDTASVPIIIISGFLDEDTCRLVHEQDYIVDKAEFDVARLTELVNHIFDAPTPSA